MNKTFLSTILISGIFLIVSQCSKPSSKEFAEEFGLTVCYKMADCASEQLKDLSAEEKKFAMGMLPTRESCDSPDSKFRKQYSKESDNEKVEFTSDQIALGQKCMEKMKATACSEMEKPISECEEFSKATEMN